MDENVPSDENVPCLERKRPRFRATSTKMSYIPISLSSARTKTSQIQISKVQKRPRFHQLGRKRPRFRSARTKTSHIPISKDENVPDSGKICLVLMPSRAIFRKICEKVRLGQKYAELCGEWRIMRNCAENRKLCDIALTALTALICCL